MNTIESLQKPKVSVIDSPCGGGKSVSLHNWLDKEIRRHKVKKQPYQFIFLVPLLTEIERLEKFLTNKQHIVTSRVNDQNKDIPYQTFIPSGGTKDAPIPKLEPTLNALKAGMSAILTHQLFLQNPKVFCNIITEKNIHLIIDETLTMFTYHPTKTKDFDLWISHGKISWDRQTYKLSFEEDIDDYSKDNTSFFEILKRIKDSSVYYYKGITKKKDIGDEEDLKEVEIIETQECITKQKGIGTCIEVFPVEYFIKLPHIIISTYLFEGDPMKIYLDMCKVDYSYYHVVENDNQQGNNKSQLQKEYVLERGVPQSSGKDFKDLIEIYEPEANKKGDSKINHNNYWFYDDYTHKGLLINTLSYSKSKALFLSNEETRTIEESKVLRYLDKEFKGKLLTREEYDDIIKQNKYTPVSYIQQMPQDKQFWEDYKTIAEKPTAYPPSHYIIEDLCKKLKVPLNQLEAKIENTAYLATRVKYYLDKVKAKPEEILWTSFKDQSWGLETDKTIARDTKIQVQNKKHSPNFCQSSIRATNDFRETSVLVFLINKFWNRFIYRAITLINKDMPALDKIEVIKGDIPKNNISLPTIDDMYGLSVLIQWMFRSRIRKSPRESIKIYIPSKRMRDLLYKWLEGNFDTKVLLELKKKLNNPE